jgi:phage N-6-adenine-methyltransferase
MPAQKPGRSKQNYATPLEFIAAVEKRFGRLTCDLAAEADNAVVPGAYYNERDDSLSRSWTDPILGARMWLNPPFGDIEPWARKCAEARGRTIYFLVPASVGSNWYAQWVHERALVLFLSPRLSFDGKNPYPKDCILACYGHQPGYQTWRWQ